MAHVDLFEAQKLLRRPSPGSLRRQAFAGAAILMLGGGYFIWHASAKLDVPPPAAVSVETLQPRHITPSSHFSGRSTAVDYAKLRAPVSPQPVAAN